MLYGATESHEMIRTLTLVSAVAVAAALTTPAAAGGFIGDIFRTFGFNQLGDGLDYGHRQLNKPLDQFNPFDPKNGFRAAPSPAATGQYCQTNMGVFGPGPV